MRTIRPIRAIALAGIAGLLVLTAAAPAAAYQSVSKDKTFGFTNQRNTSFLLRDKTPRAARVVLVGGKKPGRAPCRVHLIRVNRNKAVFSDRNIVFRNSRDNPRSIRYQPFRNGSDRWVRVIVRTNGRCVIGVGLY